MNIIDEWDLNAADAYGSSSQQPFGGMSGGGQQEGNLMFGASPGDLDTVLDAGAQQLNRERPIFSVEVVERNLAHGRGDVSAVAAASDCIVVGTTRGFLLRYDFSQGTAPVSEIELSKVPSSSVTAVFLDPTATHVVACVANDSAGGIENHYAHAKWKKSRLMAKLKGVSITSIGWSEAPQLSEASTGPVLVGTKHGVLAELQVDEKDKREKHFKHLYSVGEGREPICSVSLTKGGGPGGSSDLTVMAVTPTRLYLFKGDRSLEHVFAAYLSVKAPLAPLVELPGDDYPVTELHTRKDLGLFAWLAEPGIYLGKILKPGDDAPSDGSDAVQPKELLPFPNEHKSGQWPVSMAVTDHHFLLLYKTKLIAINQVSRGVVQEVPLVGAAARGLAGMPLGLSVDAESQTVFMYTGEALHEVTIRDEARDMWHIYMAKKEFREAAAFCFTPEQKSAVMLEEAEAAFRSGSYQEAARLFARLNSVKPTFEQVALRFVEIGSPVALHEFLLRKLEALSSDDRAQATMVATWLTELQLDQINRALLDDEGEAGAECQELIESLRGFLTAYKDVLDDATTTSLLASYGRLDELMHFAAMNDDSETVIEHLMQRGEVLRALGVLRKPNISLELVYKFAPVLLSSAPAEAVDAWIKAGTRLSPRRLMPALLRSEEHGASAAMRQQALRYIEYCINNLESDDNSLHNLAVSLYSIQEDESSLIAYLKQAKGPLGRPLYDDKFALRLARERNRTRACVHLLSDMGMYQDATALALKVDVELAKEVAELPEDDAPLRRKLWLAIARHLVEAEEGNADQGARIRQAVAFLKETQGLLKIEDILPFFPDFVLIDEFKDAICTSLEEYNRQIEELKFEMDGATEIADVLRKDLAAVETRCAVVDLGAPCERCGRSLHSGPPPSAGPSGGCQQPFYVFPCGSAFHTPCLVSEVVELSGMNKGRAITKLSARLAAAPEGSETAGAWEGSPAEAVSTLQRQLEAQAAAECPRCGEMVIKLLDKPLLHDHEDEAASWAIDVVS